MVNPSKEWTDKERLEVIHAITSTQLTRWHIAPFVLADAADMAEVIICVTEQPAAFLENNREKILSAIKDI